LLGSGAAGFASGEHFFLSLPLLLFLLLELLKALLPLLLGILYSLLFASDLRLFTVLSRSCRGGWSTRYGRNSSTARGGWSRRLFQARRWRSRCRSRFFQCRFETAVLWRRRLGLLLLLYTAGTCEACLTSLLSRFLLSFSRFGLLFRLLLLSLEPLFDGLVHSRLLR
jgi:hypothetical protein